MTDENERFLLMIKDKIGEHDFERLQSIMMEEALDYIEFHEMLENADRNGEVS